MLWLLLVEFMIVLNPVLPLYIGEDLTLSHLWQCWDWHFEPLPITKLLVGTCISCQQDLSRLTTFLVKTAIGYPTSALMQHLYSPLLIFLFEFFLKPHSCICMVWLFPCPCSYLCAKATIVLINKVVCYLFYYFCVGHLIESVASTYVGITWIHNIWK